MISAKMARHIAKKDYAPSKFLTDVFKAIKSAAENGEMYCTVAFCSGYDLVKGERETLEKLGFGVVCDTICMWYEISWSKNRRK